MDASQIINLRRKLNVSQERFASLIQISAKTVSCWENGTSPRGLSLQKLQKIDLIASYDKRFKQFQLAVALGISSHELDALIEKHYSKCRELKMKEILSGK